MKLLLRIFALLLWETPLLLAQQEHPGLSNTNIFVEMQIVAIPRDIAMPLVRDLMEKEKIEAACLRIQDLLDKKTAKLIGWPMVTTQSGERAVIESIGEFRFASEYLPGVIDFYSSNEKGVVTKLPANIEHTQFNGTPSAFETRNTGVTLEVVPTLSVDESTVTMLIVPQHIVLKGLTKSTVEKEKTHEKIVVEQPQFATMKVYTKLVLKAGGRILIGVYPATEYPDHLELFILHVEVRKVQ